MSAISPGSEGAYDVELHAVTKRFGSLTAVNAVTLKVRRGEFLSLLVTELEAHQGDAPQHDDITIVTGRTVAEEESGKEPLIEG